MSGWTNIQRYLTRSLQAAVSETHKTIRMSSLTYIDEPKPPRAPKALLTFNTQEDVEGMYCACDQAIGGQSTVHIELDKSTSRPDQPHTRAGEEPIAVSKPTAKFWGDMSLKIRPDYERMGVRSGYAFFRNEHRNHLFGVTTEDLSNHEFLALRVRIGGHPRTRNSYFVNLQLSSDNREVWQHPLYFRREDGGWEDVVIPFCDFSMREWGEDGGYTTNMRRSRRATLRSVGVGILGGNTGVEGRYELGIDSICALNAEDLTKEVRMGISYSNHFTRQMV